MCEVLEISPKTYYKYRHITDALRASTGWVVNHKKILRIMKKYGIQPQYIKNQHRQFNIKKHPDLIKPDLLRRNFSHGWVTDVTYLDYAGKRAFLSTILDLKSRAIVASQISNRNDNKLVLDTLHKALRKTKDPRGLILHSDQGAQYYSTEYRSICESKGILISMARRGTPLDNAVIESFHSILKKETLYNNDIKDHKEYLALIRKWLRFYNTSRLKNKK